MLGRIEQQNCDPSEAFIMATTEGKRPKIMALIERITNYAVAFQCNPGKFKYSVNHAVTFSFEWVFMSMFKGIPGYALEKFFNFGTKDLREKLNEPEGSFDEIVDCLR
jgi:hypothetical protein